MNKKKLFVASLVLVIISALIFVLFIFLHSTVIDMFKEAKEAEGTGQEGAAKGVGIAFGMLIMLPVLFIVGAVNEVLSIISIVFSIRTIVRRNEYGKLPLSVVITIINAAIITAVPSMIIPLWFIN